MEWLGVWNGWGYGIAIFRALNFQISEPEIWQKSLFLQNFRDFPGKIRPLKNIFRTLENGHSIRHQSIPPLIAGRCKELPKCKAKKTNRKQAEYPKPAVLKTLTTY